MSFPRYPKYKPSGVEWLGDVPAVWDVKRIGYFFTERREKVSDKDYPALSVTMKGIVPQLDTAAKTDDGDNRKKVLKGDFVINSRSDRKGSSGASELDGSVSLICTVLTPQERVHTPFIHHLLRSQPFQEEFYRNGKGIVADLWSTNYSEMRNILLGMPPLAEQTRIAEFLDLETAKIDELVAEQRRLMELLKEKRQAVISHAVTRGLNPQAPLKPSGIEWLGDIPTHWDVKRLKHVVLPLRGIQMGPFGGMLKDLRTEPTAFKLYGQENTINDDFASGSRWLSEEHFDSLSEYELQPGDLVLTRIGASIGHCRLVPVGIQRGVIDSDTIRVRLDPNVVSVGFAVTLMHEGYMESAILQRQKGSVLPGLNTDTIANLQIAVPPPEEQKFILAFLAEQIARFDTLTAEAQRAIDLLQERRTALISAAVTGQIDVRGLASGQATKDQRPGTAEAELRMVAEEQAPYSARLVR
jgi:type I restriction enzyme S subunit